MKNPIVSLSEIEYRIHVDAFDGLCLNCAEWTTGGVEPDAEGYRCESCRAHEVKGAEDALIEGYVEITI